MDSRLPLHDWHLRLGARMVPFAGYTMPVQYEGIIAEHRWTRSHAGLFDVSHMGQVRLQGPDLDAAVERLLPIDLATLGEGRVRYSLLLSEEGTILDDLMVTRREDGLLVIVNGAVKQTDIAHLRAHLPETVTLEHRTDQALLALQGPEAVTVLARFDRRVAQLAFLQAGAFVLGGIPCWISRSGYSGEDGFEISVAADQVERLAVWLSGEPEVRPIGLGARDSLRLEAGLPLYGHDLDTDTTPVAGGVGFAIARRRRREGGFPGADRVNGEFTQPPATVRAGLIVEGRQPVREGATVQDASGATVGRVTSGGFGPTIDAPIALADLPPQLAAPDTTVTLVQRGKPHQARVTPLPFVPHRYVRTGASA